MKRWKTGLAVLILTCLLPIIHAAAWTGTVTASSLNMRQSASSDSKVVSTLKKGTNVEVISTKGSWYKIKAGGKTGYAAKKYITKSTSGSSGSSKSSSKTKSASSSGNGTCSVGDQGDSVKAVQKKLKSLGYYSGSIDGDYGNGTKKAVIAFQKANGLKQTGNVNSSTLSKLNGSGKSSSSSSGSSSGKSGDPCAPGDKGAAVKAVQKRLKSLGYYTGSVDGDYGNGTKSAVKAFQKANGLTVNGVANSKTVNKLNSSGAKKASSGSGGGGSSGTGTESLNWFKHPNTIPHHATFKVKDVRTGKVFNVKRWTGANHADCEPASAKDTAIMKSIYGHWSWKRRPILVKYNGHVYAASMNGMPHGTQTIKNNNFNGHFCIHFTGSKTHGSKKVDSEHQNCVKTALKHSW